MKLFDFKRGILFVLLLFGTQNLMAVMYDYVGIDNATSFPSDYIGKNVYFLCKNNTIREDNDVNGWDISSSCLQSDKQYELMHNFVQLKIFTINKDVAKELSTNRNTTYKLFGQVFKNDDNPMAFYQYGFNVIDAQDNSNPFTIKANCAKAKLYCNTKKCFSLDEINGKVEFSLKEFKSKKLNNCTNLEKELNTDGSDSQCWDKNRNWICE